jgi:putative ABC transport system permease protein
MRTLLDDFRYGLRRLLKSPAFTTVAVVILALGIGANSAIYTLLDQVLLRSLPVKEPDRLVLLRYSGANNGYSSTRADQYLYFSYPMYRDLRDHNSVFSGLIATAWAQVGVQWHNEPGLAEAELVSGNYFDVLGVQPALGRLFVPAEDLVLAAPIWLRSAHFEPKRLHQWPSVYRGRRGRCWLS